MCVMFCYYSYMSLSYPVSSVQPKERMFYAKFIDSTLSCDTPITPYAYMPALTSKWRKDIQAAVWPMPFPLLVSFTTVVLCRRLMSRPLRSSRVPPHTPDSPLQLARHCPQRASHSSSQSFALLYPKLSLQRLLHTPQLYVREWLQHVHCALLQACLSVTAQRYRSMFKISIRKSVVQAGILSLNLPQLGRDTGRPGGQLAQLQPLLL